MKIFAIHQLTLEWSAARGILANGNTKTQMFKLGSEIGELCSSVANGENPKDDIGDCMVLMTNICHLEGIMLPISVLHEQYGNTFTHRLNPSRLALGVSTIFGDMCDRVAKEASIEDLVKHMVANLEAVAHSHGHSLLECWEHAYDDIKDRRGFLNASGNFIKDTDPLYEQLIMEFNDATRNA